MITQHFLGWHLPFITLSVDWLWEHKDSLASMLVVVPTNESGRKVRQALAEKGPCLVPQFCTSGKFGAMGYQGSENLLLEQLVWEKVLSSHNWNTTQDIFPKPQAEHWAKDLTTCLLHTAPSARDS